MTNHEAKLYLAEKLPKRIKTVKHNGIDDEDYYMLINGKPTGIPILETEWQQIALWVLQKQSMEDKEKVCKISGLKHDYCAWIDLTIEELATAMKESGL